MIEAVYNRTYHKLTVKGHSGSAEKGQDLICAAASILVYTLANAVIGADLESKLRNRPTVRLEEGDAEISYAPLHSYRNVMLLMSDSICAGFDILAQKYPEFVKYTVVG